jgi:hypothetical protein
MGDELLARWQPPMTVSRIIPSELDVGLPYRRASERPVGSCPAALLIRRQKNVQVALWAKSSDTSLLLEAKGVCFWLRSLVV